MQDLTPYVRSYVRVWLMKKPCSALCAESSNRCLNFNRI